MSDVGDAINEVRSSLAGAASEFMADLCDLSYRTSTAGSSGGRTESFTSTGTNIPCTYRALSASEQQRAGASSSLLTHQIKLPSTAITEAIRPNYKIVVQSRDHTPTLTFENPVIMSASLSAFVVVAAALKV